MLARTQHTSANVRKLWKSTWVPWFFLFFALVLWYRQQETPNSPLTVVNGKSVTGGGIHNCRQHTYHIPSAGSVNWRQRCVVTLLNACFNFSTTDFRGELLVADELHLSTSEGLWDGTPVIGARILQNLEFPGVKWHERGTLLSVHPENIGHVLLDSLTPFLAFLFEASNISAIFATHWRRTLIGQLARDDMKWFDIRGWQTDMLTAVTQSASCRITGKNKKITLILPNYNHPTTLFCAKVLDVFREGCDSYQVHPFEGRFQSRVYFPLLREVVHNYLLKEKAIDLSFLQSKKGGIVIFARNLASRRRISNYVQVVETIKTVTDNKLNVEVSNFFSNMTLAQQATLVAGAQVIISTFGAHESNFIFLRKSALYIQVVRSCGVHMTPAIVHVNSRYTDVPGEIQLLWEKMANYNDILVAARAVHYVVCTCTYQRKHSGWTKKTKHIFRNIPSSIKLLDKGFREGERDSPEDITIPTFQVGLIADIIKQYLIDI